MVVDTAVKKELHREMVELFLKYDVVLQGYDYEWWSREQQERAVGTGACDDKFETIVEYTVEDMLYAL